MAITAALVKELRERTGAGMMDCKKALVETDGDIEVAIENMRKSGQAKAAKKAGNIAAEGTILTRQADGVAVLVEVNCQTDFVAKDKNFLAFANEVADAAIASVVTIDALKEQFEETRVALVAKIGENINIRRIQYVEGAEFADYRHGDRIGVVVAGSGDAETLKHVAMHVAASKPEYVNPEDVPAEVVEKEKAIQIEIAMNEGKPAEIAEKMVTGRMKKFTGEVSLTGQAFIMEPKKSVGEYLKEKGTSVTTFVRLEVGEGIEKKQEDFAAEVQAQVAAAKGQ
ncbi:translation elongation factor Ts [Catenovulum agarivorans]|uniref:translation elongation factor Ts n=1 Tax=Catenovulum agarivorans TaxID=1172192 RepID=UPI0002EFB1F4|nr:translation elongation factor Ts [Catenovulum agarivorans]